ncbi:hypothetical protein ACFLQK_01660 [bacterium]
MNDTGDAIAEDENLCFPEYRPDIIHENPGRAENFFRGGKRGVDFV